jgi:hypothetical protein
MKLTLILSGLFLAFAWLNLPPEPDLTSEYSATPFERCERAYRGTEKVRECIVLRGNKEGILR